MELGQVGFTGLGGGVQRGKVVCFVHKRLEAGFAGVCWPVRPCESRLKEWLLWWVRMAAVGLAAHRFGSTACGGIVEVRMTCKLEAHREGFAENRIGPFLWMACGEVYFIMYWLFVECLFKLCIRCRRRIAPSQILEHEIYVRSRILFFGFGYS